MQENITLFPVKTFRKKNTSPQIRLKYAPVALPSQTYMRLLKALTPSNLQVTKNIDKLHRITKTDGNQTQTLL